MIISGESHLLLASVSSLVPWLYVLCRHNIAWPFLPASLQLLHCAFWLDDHCCHHTKEKATPQSFQQSSQQKNGPQHCNVIHQYLEYSSTLEFFPVFFWPSFLASFLFSQIQNCYSIQPIFDHSSYHFVCRVCSSRGSLSRSRLEIYDIFSAEPYF